MNVIFYLNKLERVQTSCLHIVRAPLKKDFLTTGSVSYLDYSKLLKKKVISIQ